MEDHTANNKTDDKWYYIIVQNPDTSTEQFVGFSSEEDDNKFIPAFKTKEEATACFALMPKDLFNGEYAAQAVIEEDLINIAEDNGHSVYLLDEKGTILKHLNEPQES